MRCLTTARRRIGAATSPARAGFIPPPEPGRGGHIRNIIMESNPTLTDVVGVKPPAPYIGGKRVLAERLVHRINQIPHASYCEAFVGMGGVFFRRTKRPSVEVINDWSADVATLFRVLQRHYQAFLDMIRWQLSGRAEWDRLIRQDADTLTDLERAARFLYLQRNAYGGKVNGRNFAMTPATPSRFDITRLAAMLEDVHERLAGVTIERLPWQDFIRRYDRAEALIYLDPPYWGNETDYGAGMFAREDFARMAGQLHGLKGSFLLSINDRPEIRELFAWARIEEVELNYRLSGKPTAAAELIITSSR